MASILAILGSPAFLGLLGTVFTGVFGVIQTTNWWKKINDSKFAKAVACLQGGVQVAYEEYVKDIKAASADGSLTPDEEAAARKMAIDAAVTFGKSQGVDVIATLGADYLDTWIKGIIAKLKNAARLPDTAAANLEGAGL